MILLNNDLPTSTLLEIKTGQMIELPNNIFGKVDQIEIQENDQFLLFIFTLSSGQIAEIRKMKQIC
ncbi:hypothetical protein ACJVDH_10285 [Pedobacter sp. AW1-32]|uniref:hypothetical protein n=1 Tax=Pedobacter sp. AW1-32 TaxID=3383026 RepID=UPI003FEE495E